MARAKEEQKEAIVVSFPNGMMVNGSVFEKDQFNDQSTPSYKIEVAYPKDALDGVIEKLLDAIEQEWPDIDLDKPEGQLNIDGGPIISGILDGDKLAAKREKSGKKGDAYKGKWVVRANTIYNLNGQDAPGGVQVWDADLEPITPANQGQIYPGCIVQMAASIGTYEKETEDGGTRPALKFYLQGIQKTGDGERLFSAKDTSVLFKKVGRAAPAEGGTGRRSRKG